MISRNLQRGITEGLYREDIDVDVMTRLRLFTMMLSFNPAVFPGNRHNILHIEEELFLHFLRGLATPKGEKLIVRYIKQRTK
jgi:TetR/AcrR family transcriptional regulator, cholesterol catabolism regulator